MESDARYYARRAVEEKIAASRAVTDAARKRREWLAASFAQRARELAASA